MTKQTRTTDSRPTCGFGNCVAPMVAAAVVQTVRHLDDDKAIDDRTDGVLLLCATHWSKPPDRW